jgi:hypothetical protein
MSTAHHHLSAPLSSSPFCVRSQEDFCSLKRVLARALPDVKSGHLAEALAAGLGHATYSGMLAAAARVPPGSSGQESRKQVGIDSFLGRLRRFGYTEEQLHPLSGHASGLLRLTTGKFMCSNDSCLYGPGPGVRCDVPEQAYPVVSPHARDEAYSTDPAYRAVWSNGMVTAPQDGLCLNCYDDMLRDRDMGDYD